MIATGSEKIANLDVIFTDIMLDQLLHRVPSLENAEVRQLLNGPESFTPDGKFIIGEAPEVN